MLQLELFGGKNPLCYMDLVLDFDIIRWIFSYYFLVYIEFPCDYLFESLEL